MKPNLHKVLLSEPIQESKNMCVIIKKKCKKMFIKEKTFENLGKNVQNLEIF